MIHGIAIESSQFSGVVIRRNVAGLCHTHIKRRLLHSKTARLNCQVTPADSQHTKLLVLCVVLKKHCLALRCWEESCEAFDLSIGELLHKQRRFQDSCAGADYERNNLTAVWLREANP